MYQFGFARRMHTPFFNQFNSFQALLGEKSGKELIPDVPLLSNKEYTF
jgi:hypothetical protein